MSTTRRVFRMTAAVLLVVVGLATAAVVFDAGWPLAHKQHLSGDVIETSPWEIDWSATDWSLTPDNVGCGGPQRVGEGVGPDEYCFSHKDGRELKQDITELQRLGRQQRLLTLGACSLILIGSIGGAVLLVRRPRIESDEERPSRSDDEPDSRPKDRTEKQEIHSEETNIGSDARTE